MSVQTYSPSEVNVYIALLYAVENYSPNSLLTLSKDESNFKLVKGASGSSERVRVSDNTYTLQLSLSQTSSTNTILNALASFDRVSGIGTFPIFAKDSSGDSLFLAGSCWIESPPEISYTNGIETRDWEIKCHNLINGLGGNSEGGLAGDLAQITGVLSQFI